VSLHRLKSKKACFKFDALTVPQITERQEKILKRRLASYFDDSKLIRCLRDVTTSRDFPKELTCSFSQYGVHLVNNAVMVSCCGYFICCEECKQFSFSYLIRFLKPY
jgi:hypothetical protein